MRLEIRIGYFIFLLIIFWVDGRGKSDSYYDNFSKSIHGTSNLKVWNNKIE